MSEPSEGKAARLDAAQAAQWLAEAERLLRAIEQIGSPRAARADLRIGAVLEMLPALGDALDLAKLAASGKKPSLAEFYAASSVMSAASALHRIAAAAGPVDPASFGHAGWLIGRAHALASVKVSSGRKKPGRERGSGTDPWQPHIEKALLEDLSAPNSDVLKKLEKVSSEPPDESYVNKERRRLLAAGRK